MLKYGRYRLCIVLFLLLNVTPIVLKIFVSIALRLAPFAFWPNFVISKRQFRPFVLPPCLWHLVFPFFALLTNPSKARNIYPFVGTITFELSLVEQYIP